MRVNIKLEFSDGQDLQRMIDLLWKIECPCKSANCKECRYHESCLKLRDITNKLGSVIVYDN